MNNSIIAPATEKSGISVTHLCKSFGEKQVIKDLSFSIEYGSTALIRGDSGSGKTTLLRLLAGIIKPDSGDISGIDRKRLSLLFQEDRLLPWFTALQNVEAVIRDKEKKPLAAELLSELGLGDKKDMLALPSELSGGMNRRVAIARALAYDSDILILDEALRGLDEANTEKTVSVIKKYSEGKTLISVTHSPSALEENAQLTLYL